MLSINSGIYIFVLLANTHMIPLLQSIEQLSYFVISVKEDTVCHCNT